MFPRPLPHAARLVVAAGALVVSMCPQAALAQPRLGDLVPSSAERPATEQQWIELDVVRGIAAMAQFARTGALPRVADVQVELRPDTVRPDAPSAVHRVSVAGRTLGATLTVSDHVWAPATYVPIARELLRGVTRVTTASDAASRRDDTLAALTDPTIEALLAANRRISAALASGARDPDAHDAAALLLGVLVLREGAGSFSDPRRALNRMAAHLAIAEALREPDPPTKLTAIARVVQYVAAGRERDALAWLGSVEQVASTEADRAWARALRLHATEDWRVGVANGRATLLERLAHARAVRARLGDAELLNTLDSSEDELVPDWSRIALSRGYGVETSHRYVPLSLALEVREAAAAWQDINGDLPAHDRFLARLNDEPAISSVPLAGPGATVRVLDWGTWAQIAHRHICARVADGSYRLGGVLGQADQAKEYDRDARRAFASLRLFPLVQALRATDAAAHRAAMTAVTHLVGTRPDLVTAPVWMRLRHPSWIGADAPTTPPELTWFRPLVLAGTLFEAQGRAFGPDCPLRPTRQQVAEMRALAPSHYRVAWEHGHHELGDHPVPDAAERALSPFIAYDATALIGLHAWIEGHSAARVAVARRACAMAPDQCNTLAHTLRDEGRADEAAEVYLEWAEHARDTVRVSNDMEWVVHFLLDRGQREEALALAERGARTYSGGGFSTMTQALERVGRADEAREYCRKAWDNYDDAGGWLLACAIRLGLGDEEMFRQKVRRSMERTFPVGLEPIEAGSLRGTPRDGLVVRNATRRARSLGLEDGVHIVGLDGYRVRNDAQYQVMVRLRLEPDVRLIVWRGSRYEEVALAVPQRWFGVGFDDYKEPAISGAR